MLPIAAQGGVILECPVAAEAVMLGDGADGSFDTTGFVEAAAVLNRVSRSGRAAWATPLDRCILAGLGGATPETRPPTVQPSGSTSLRPPAVLRSHGRLERRDHVAQGAGLGREFVRGSRALLGTRGGVLRHVFDLLE